MTMMWHRRDFARASASGPMFEAAFYCSAIGKAIVAVDGRCMEVNIPFAAMLGYTPEEVAGRHFADFTFPDDIDVDLDLFAAVMRGDRDSYRLEKRYLHRDGGIVHVLLSATVVRAGDGTPIQFISEVIDLTEQKRVEQALEYANAELRLQVVTDPLTGLCNRRGFEEALDATPDEAQATLLVIDLDHFKMVNDRFGHQAGDALLIEAGARLARIARDGDLVARVGGDEFCMLLYGADNVAAGAIAQRIVTAMAHPFAIGEHSVGIGASVGGCWSDRATTGLRALAASADGALYEAKGAGRAGWRITPLNA